MWCDNLLVIAIITVPNIGAAWSAANNRKHIIIENCATFTKCMSELDNTQRNNANDFDIVMPMYNLIEYSANYSKTFGSLRDYHRD